MAREINFPGRSLARARVLERALKRLIQRTLRERKVATTKSSARKYTRATGVEDIRVAAQVPV